MYKCISPSVFVYFFVYSEICYNRTLFRISYVDHRELRDDTIFILKLLSISLWRSQCSTRIQLILVKNSYRENGVWDDKTALTERRYCKTLKELWYVRLDWIIFGFGIESLKTPLLSSTFSNDKEVTASWLSFLESWCFFSSWWMLLHSYPYNPL